MAKKRNNSVFDLVFNDVKPRVSVEKNKAVYEAITEEINISLSVGLDDVTVSSMEDRYVGRVSLKIFNM